MSKRQFFALFVSSLVPWAVGNGLLPLLPGYFAQLGAEPGLIGYYLAFNQLTLAMGCVVAGWLSDKTSFSVGRRCSSRPVYWLSLQPG
jgi:MFS family permease